MKLEHSSFTKIFFRSTQCKVLKLPLTPENVPNSFPLLSEALTLWGSLFILFLFFSWSAPGDDVNERKGKKIGCTGGDGGGGTREGRRGTGKGARPPPQDTR